VEELRRKGIDDEATGKLTPVLQLQGANEEKLTQLKKILAASETGLEGYKEVTYILEKLKILRPAAEVVFDLTLARGLDYYTGAIFEVKAKHTPMGSICGGGRYDDLTGVFGLREVSGVGISFGADRIFDVMTSEDLFPKEVATTTKVMFVNFGEKEQDYCLPMLQRLREEGIASEIFPAQAKIKKQMTYANKKGIPYVIMAGESEMEQQVFTLKEMETGNQETLSATELIGKLQS
jgi:histidyl-tRNA synthetase